MHLRIALLLAIGATVPSVAPAQSLLDRPPNLTGDWVGTGGTLYFHFLHRFTESGPPERKVTNVPTFLIGLGLPGRAMVGAHYATNSRLAPRYPNEWEFFARYAPLAQGGGAPVDLAGQASYNLAAEGVDGELSLARRLGPLRLLAAARVLADPYTAGETRFALAAGATLRLWRHFALAGDVTRLANADSTERMAWSAGLHVAIPYTPHTFSLQATNVNAATLQGSSRGEDVVRYGFEFTIPVTLRRYFGGGAPRPPAPRPTPPVAASGAAPAGALLRADIKGFVFAPARLEIAAGTTVEWANGDQMAHTVTAVDGSFASPPIEPGASWRHTFTTPGSYDFFCTPHPFMKGVVVVK